MHPLHLNDANFKKEVLESSLPVLVDFWAPWCAPCKMISPVIEELAREYSQKIKVGKINIDQDAKVASFYGVMSIPTVMLFKGGKVIEQLVGAASKSEFKKRIDANL